MPTEVKNPTIQGIPVLTDCHHYEILFPENPSQLIPTEYKNCKYPGPSDELMPKEIAGKRYNLGISKSHLLQSIKTNFCKFVNLDI